MAIGKTLAGFIAHQQFWKLFETNRGHGIAAFKAIAKFQTAGIIGLLLLILSGLTMLTLVQWTFLSLLWFKIKLFIVLLLIVNGFTLGRTSTLRLQRFVLKGVKHAQPDAVTVKRSVRIFQAIQLSLFLLIILLSVFRFT
jgi:hypothetical protein